MNSKNVLLLTFLLFSNLTLIHTHQLEWGVDTIQNKRLDGSPCHKNEDRFSISGRDNICLFIVFDGHGGTRTSTFLKDNFATEFYKYLDETNSVEEALEKASETTENVILKNFRDGSTLVAVVYDGKNDRWVTANVGDSRAVIFNLVTKEIRFTTKDHNPRTNKNERKRFFDAGGTFYGGYFYIKSNPCGLAMSRCFGDEDLKPKGSKAFIAKPDIEEIERYEKDSLIVGSDGIWDVISPEKATSLLLKHKDKSAQKIAKILCKEAEEESFRRLQQFKEENRSSWQSKRQDDITVIVVKDPLPLMEWLINAIKDCCI